MSLRHNLNFPFELYIFKSKINEFNSPSHTRLGALRRYSSIQIVVSKSLQKYSMCEYKLSVTIYDIPFRIPSIV